MAAGLGEFSFFGKSDGLDRLYFYEARQILALESHLVASPFCHTPRNLNRSMSLFCSWFLPQLSSCSRSLGLSGLKIAIGINLVIVIAAPCMAQTGDIARLIHPDVADKLSLTDAQRAELQKNRQERTTAVAAATDPAEKARIAGDFDQKALALLTDEQRSLFANLEPLRKLKFQFRDVKWDEVLSWFAEQQDLTLVMDRIPPGSFTYMDVREYTPSEGIDLLNSVLLTRGFALVRREKMLVVMELSDSIPLELIPRVTQDKLLERGQFELVSVIFPLGGRPIDAVLSEVKPYLSNFGRAIPLAQGGQLLVVENAGKMKTINELIASVPVPQRPPKPEPPPPPPQPVFAAYPIAGLDAAATLKTIQTLVPSQQITVDAKTNVLSAFVIPAQQTAIKSALDQMIASYSQLPGNRAVAYQVPADAVAEIVKHLQTLVPDASILPVSDRVLVSASPEQQQLIRDDLAKLDIYPVEQTGKSMKFFELDSKLLASVEPALKTIIPNLQVSSNPTAGSLIVRGTDEDLTLVSEIIDSWKQASSNTNFKLRSFDLGRPATATWLTTVAKIVPNATTWLDEEGRKLTVLSSPEELLILEANLASLVEQIPIPLERFLRIYPLSKSQVSRRQMLSELPQKLSTIKILDSSSGRELYVWATSEQHEEFSNLLESIDTPLPTGAPKLPRTYKVDFQNVTLVHQILTAEFSDATITLDSAGNSLTVVAEESTHTKLAARLELFQENFPKKAPLRLENYSVKGMTAEVLQNTLAPLLTKARVNVDSRNARLLITADEETHSEIAELVAALSDVTTPDLQKVAIVYPIDHAKATQVKLVVDQLGLTVTTVADDALKQVVVTGTIEDHAVVKSMISQMDRASLGTTDKQIRTFDTKKVSSAYLLPVLQKLWPDVDFSADPSSNRVIASGSVRQLDELTSAMDRLIASPDGATQSVKTYQIASGDMVTLPVILGQIAPQALLSVDAISRTITVWANEEQHARVEQAIEQISKVAQSAKTPMTYRVNPTHAAPIQLAVQSLVPNVSAAVIGTTGQLIVVGSEAQQRKVAEIIDMLSKELDQSNRTVRVIKLDPDLVDQASLLAALQNTIPPQVKLESNPINRTIMVIGTAGEVEAVEKKIEEIKPQIPAAPNKVVKQYPINTSDSTTLLSVFRANFPTVSVVPDLVQKTFVVTASDDEHSKVDEFLKGYDLPRSPVFFDLKATSSASVLASLKALYPGVTMTFDAPANRVMAIADEQQKQRIADSIQSLERGLDTGEKMAKVFTIDADKYDVVALSTHLKSLIPPHISLEANARSSTILVIGTEGDLAEVAAKLESLQQQMPPANLGQTVVYKLKYAPAASATGINTIISTLYKDVTSYGDPVNGTLVVTATPIQHENISAIVKGYDQGANDLETQVFTLTKADPLSLRTSLSGGDPRITITADTATNSLIVTAPSGQMERIKKALIELEKSHDQRKTIQSYSLLAAEPTALARALGISYPKATITADATNSAIFVAATPEEHEAISKLVDDLNDLPSERGGFKIASLQYTNPESLAKTITAALGPRSRLVVTAHRESRSLFAVGTPVELRTFEQLVEQLDTPEKMDDDRQFESFPLKGVDGTSIVSSLTKLLAGNEEPPDIKYDSLNRQILAAGTKEQIAKIKEALSKFDAPKRDFEIFTLKTIDPFTFRTAAEALFEQEPPSNQPSINIDNSLQQALVHGTKEQLERIEQLIVRMNQGSSTTKIVNRQGVRIVPVNRDPQALLENVQKLWPKIRTNPIQVIDPKKIQRISPDDLQSNNLNANPSKERLVSFTDSVNQDSPPVILITGDEQWTIASEDEEALGQFESLLENILNPSVQPYATAGNFGVYILRHAAAAEVRDLLMDVFGLSSGRPSFGNSMQRLKIVADPRINALVIGGNLADRRTAEELLGVIDSKDLIDRLQQITPKIVTLKTANAKNVLDVVQDVYKSQLSSGAGRKPLPIPEGVSTEVATIFQQLNAAASGPLLTIAIDPTSNSLVLRGPGELTDEVTEFINKLEKQYEDAPAQRIQVLRLESTNSANLERALRLLYTK